MDDETASWRFAKHDFKKQLPPLPLPLPPGDSRSAYLLVCCACAVHAVHAICAVRAVRRCAGLHPWAVLPASLRLLSVHAVGWSM